MSISNIVRWHRNIAPASKYPTIFEGGRNKHVAILVTKSHLWTEEQLERNANLIAAAPRLLDELKEAVQNCPCSVAERDSGHRVGCNAPCWQAAIDEAEGRSND